MHGIFGLTAIAATLAIASLPANAQGAGTGQVGRACAGDLKTHCVGARHGGRQARNCLEAHRASVSAACRRALDTTGGGRGLGRNRQSSI
jgi:hypothetical protein